jgi:hypothetical protein
MRAAALQLKQSGFDPIPMNGKAGPFKGWPRMRNEPERIRRWSARTVAIRLKGSDLFVIDIDVNVAAVRDAIMAELTARWPAFMVSCLRRHSQRTTIALVGRASTVKQNFVSRRFVGEGTDPKGDKVEFFTGASVRYLGVWGAHSENREYRFDGPSILETPVTSLPWFPDKDIYRCCDACEAVMQARGLVAKSAGGGTARATLDVYDLEPGMVFEFSDGEKVKIEDLEDYAAAHAYAHARGRASGTPRRGFARLWDPNSMTEDRVSVLTGSSGLILHDFKSGISHRWKDRAPPKDFTALTALLRDVVKGAWS